MHYLYIFTRLSLFWHRTVLSASMFSTIIIFQVQNQIITLKGKEVNLSCEDISTKDFIHMKKPTNMHTQVFCNQGELNRHTWRQNKIPSVYFRCCQKEFQGWGSRSTGKFTTFKMIDQWIEKAKIFKIFILKALMFLSIMHYIHHFQMWLPENMKNLKASSALIFDKGI